MRAAAIGMVFVLAGCAAGSGVPADPREVRAAGAPSLGPYASAVVAGDFVYLSGQLPYDATTRSMTAGDIGTQTRQALANVQTLLDAAGTERDRVVKVTVYLADAADFAGMNTAYAEFFGEHRPARTTAPGIALPPGVRIEIDAVALRGR
ncbi:MAG: Rid family detoxifying hydrolase [Steroidobacteraceae bacterium]